MRIEPTPRGIMSAFFRQKYRFLLTLLIVGGAVAAYLAYATPVYLSQGSLLVRFGNGARPDIRRDTAMGGGAANPDAEKSDLMSSYVQLMQSRSLLLPIVQKLDPYQLYPKLKGKALTQQRAEDAVIDRLVTGGDLIVKPNGESPVLTITNYNANPKLAAEFVRQLMSAFMARQRQLFDDPQLGFLEGEVTRASNDLAARQKELADFKEREGLTNIESEIGQLLQEKADVRSAAVQQVTDAQTTLDEVRSKQSDLLSTYKPNSYAVSRMQDDLATAERRVAQRRADLDSLNNEGRGTGPLATHVADLNRRIETLESQRTRYNDLSRAVTLAEADYKNLQGHIEDARATQKMEQQNINRVSVLDVPEVAAKPARPKKQLVAWLGGVAALLLGIGTVIALETLDDRFSNPEQLAAALRLPVMATFGKARRA